MSIRIFLTTIVVFSTLFTFSQDKRTGIIQGVVVDSATNKPIGSSSIRIVSIKGSDTLFTVSNSTTGRFAVSVPFGIFTVEVNHIGYVSFFSAPIEVSEKNSKHDLGAVKMLVFENTLKEVVVQAEKSFMQLSLDKKIFNVGKDLANAGGSASDILMNIPSVSVDAEGAVKLRGSDNVRILIDGKPSGLTSIKGGAGLQMLQANLVERVEIITNPSARYEAEGSAGIINIILKKDKRQGFNGSFELITGVPSNFGAAANLNYRKNKINFFINYGISYRVNPYYGKLYQEVYAHDTTFILEQNNKGSFTGFNNNIRGGLDYYFTEKSVLTAAYLYRRSQGKRLMDLHYRDYFFTKNNLSGIVKRTQDEDEIEPNSEISINYKKGFAQKGHELIGEIKYIDYWENSDQTFTQNHFLADNTEVIPKRLLQHSLNDEFEKQWLFQLDYTKPLGKEGKFETGIRSSFRNMVNDYVVSEKNLAGVFNSLPGLDNVFVYDENIHGAYGILGNKSKKLSYQAGLRAEWTDVTTTLKETNEKNPRDYFNLFPSAHVTLNMEKDNGLQLSYSKRVRRPFYNDLSPYVTFSDSRNFFSGNPDLEPEFSNVFELGHIKSLEKGTISSSVYYRSTKGKIDRIRRVDDLGNSITVTENLLSESAYGVEFTTGLNPYSWWKFDFNFNFFHAEIDGSNILPDYKTRTYSWFTRQTSRFSLSKKLDLQLRMNYEAPQKTVQGRRKSIFFADVAISKDIFNESGTLTLNVLDVLNTRKSRFVSFGPNFLSDGYGYFRPRQINVSFSYRIKQSKETKNVKLIGND